MSDIKLPDGMVLVDRGALNMAINALRRDAEEGRRVRGEMADMLSASPAAPQPRDDGMPESSDERHLRRLLAVRVAMPNTYFDDGEAHGAEHGIQIDFMREPVAHIDAKLRALNVARLAVAAPQPAQQPLTDDDKRMLEMAAKAASGLVYVPEIASWIHEDANGNRGSWWRPLDDDGDAVRLACALEIDVSFRVVGGSRVEALAPGGPRIIERYTQASERASATRLAIVRAAAAIGEKMP